jgi:hypothetical protein
LSGERREGKGRCIDAAMKEEINGREDGAVVEL